MSDNDTDAAAVATERDSRPTVIGTVVSDKMDKTIVVSRDRKVLHPLYKKYVRRSTRFVAHDAENVAHSGDEVEITQTRPLSKTKRWRLVRVLREAPRGEVVTGADEALPTEEVAADEPAVKAAPAKAAPAKAETVPAETVPAETVPAETVPAETAATETESEDKGAEEAES